MNEQLSRRRALLAIGGTVAVAAVPIAAVARLESNPDAAIIAAWKERQAAAKELYFEIEGEDGVAIDARHRPLHDIINQAEDRIKNLTARTLEGVTISLWIAFAHANDYREYDEALANSDYALILAEEHRLDFHARMIVHAIRDLPSIGEA